MYENIMKNIYNAIMQTVMSILYDDPRGFHAIKNVYWL